MYYIFALMVESLKFLFPAYCANATPVLAGGGLPIDLGKKFLDGKPVFGKNKTFRGFILGLAVGTLVGLMESFLFHYHLAFGFAISLGALLGDLAGAFLKRRIGIAPGKPLPVVDQIDFVIGALLFAIPLNAPSLELAITSLVITPPIHVLTNFASYKMGLKNTPW
ncbi:MAG: CDP-2,3-bis-(O-geranylgeranyl)-sn-glycerol synthase [Candidatus Bathyarchaeota archaeon]|nr:CDP-2,3-bis-(O-geranylgeranyl)-sn-glycerol synthase [Candidatus Bathyarchaeota archaeon]MCX8177547.1 CDP-2,3-bis-(O-geranylgeranyl)-sn-glycerol synthase [Candidatus Bathyarchaeota archaeon]MDW8194363.1 CDP-2,3-bis-(O-geranylgeranyl)-sn-glycerol synthase [Nitrososphaerota archaeon]